MIVDVQTALIQTMTVLPRPPQSLTRPRTSMLQGLATGSRIEDRDDVSSPIFGNFGSEHFKFHHGVCEAAAVEQRDQAVPGAEPAVADQ